MKTIVDASNLKAATQAAIRFVPNRSSMPILTHFNLMGNGRLDIRATNLEQSIAVGVLGATNEAWQQTVPARTFADLVNTLPDGPVTLTHNPDTLTLKLACRDVHAAFRGIGSDEFPLVASAATGVTVDGNLLRAALGHVTFAASRDEAHPVLTGVLWRADGATLTLAAADGFRMSLVKLPLDSEPYAAVIPAGALDSLDKLIGDEVTVEHSETQAVFETGEVVISSRLIDAQFPDVERIIPADFQTWFSVNRADLLAAARRAMIFARDAANIVTLEIAEATVTVSAADTEAGNSRTALEVDGIEGPALTIAFDGHYLIDALNAARTDDVVLEFNKETQPCVMREADDDSTWIHVVMPMHLGNHARSSTGGRND